METVFYIPIQILVQRREGALCPCFSDFLSPSKLLPNLVAEIPMIYYFPFLLNGLSWGWGSWVFSWKPRQDFQERKSGSFQASSGLGWDWHHLHHIPLVRTVLTFECTCRDQGNWTICADNLSQSLLHAVSIQQVRMPQTGSPRQVSKISSASAAQSVRNNPDLTASQWTSVHQWTRWNLLKAKDNDQNSADWNELRTCTFFNPEKQFLCKYFMSVKPCLWSGKVTLPMARDSGD